MKTIPATIVLLATVNATQATTASLNPFSPMPATGDTTSLDYKQTSTLPRHVNAMGVGSSCAGSEGAWYCMSSAFQRCASGQWSRVVDCAEGTVCEPEGLSYEFQTAFGISAATGGATATTVTIPSPTAVVTTSSGTSTAGANSSSAETTCADTSSACSVAATKTVATTSTSTTASSTATPGAPKQDTSGGAPPGTDLSPLMGSLIVGGALLSLIAV